MSSTRLEEEGMDTSSSGKSSTGSASEVSSSTAAPNVCFDTVGRDAVHGRLRSILMSPTSYTLFRGFHPNLNQVVEEEEVSIEGIPTPLPNFFDFISNDTRKTFQTVFVDTTTAPKDDDALSTAHAFETKEACEGGNAEAIKKNAIKKEEKDIATTAEIRKTYHDDQKNIGGKQVNKDTTIVSEADFANKIRARVASTTTSQNNDVLFSVENEVACVGVDKKGRGRTDLMFSRKSRIEPLQNEHKRTPLALVEFGLLLSEDKGDADEAVKNGNFLEQLFWEKMHHVTRDVLPMLLRTDSHWEWKKSLLLAVFVATPNCSSRARLAVFVCEPKAGKVGCWRMALMWRSELDSTEKQSEAFGAFLNAVNYLAKLEEQPAPKNLMWVYLGPNCTKVKIKGKVYVARSYDNRGRHSDRNPSVYKKWGRLSKVRLDVVLLRDDHPSKTLEFAGEYDGPDALDRSMLFSKWNRNKDGEYYKGGMVQVIAVPFVEGTHECTSIIQLISLLLCLKDLHDEDFVHGDIRGRNMVFLKVPENEDISYFLPKKSNDNELEEQNLGSTDQHVSGDKEVSGDNKQVSHNPELGCSADRQVSHVLPPLSEMKRRKVELDQMIRDLPHEIIANRFKYACLIDFDYGGKLKDKPKYPPGYQQSLFDGLRWDGIAGEEIQKEHDVAATMHIFNVHHQLIDRSSIVATTLWADLIYPERNDLSHLIIAASKLLRQCEKECISPTDAYKNHLKPAEKVAMKQPRIV